MAIQAGDIVWNVGAETKDLDKALSKSSKSVKSFGESFGAVSKKAGVAFTAMGASITAAMGGAIKHFANTGDAIQKMSIRTGASTEAISELAFAAEQSGASMEDLGKAFKNQADFVEDAKDGLSTATTALDKLGLSVADLQGKTPEQVFMTLSGAIGGIVDPIERAALANDVFKRSGEALIPLFASGAEGIAQMRVQAQELGRSMSQEQADGAAKLTDNINELKSSLSGVAIQAGNALLPELNKLIPKITEVGKSVIGWVQQNPQLAQTITIVTAAAGALMTVLGPILIVLPGLATAFGAVKAAAVVVGGAIAALGAPIALLIGAVAAAAVFIVAKWDWVKWATDRVFTGIVETIKMFVRLSMKPLEALIGLVNRVIDAVNRLTGLNLGKIPGFAQGGVVQGFAQGGRVEGFANGGQVRMIRVGERGPEMMAAPVGSRVVSHPDMMRAISQGAAAGASASGGNGPSPSFNITINGDTDPNKLMEKLKGPFSHWLADEYRKARR